jgi:predicted HAD superfamily Cof-like phosphohydrolase
VSGFDARAALAELHALVWHPDTNLLWLRRTLHDEEHAELVEAIASEDRAAIARELADVVYLAYGTAHAYAIDLDVALAEVHRANLQKANGPRRADGKAMKPEGFVPPDMSGAVA